MLTFEDLQALQSEAAPSAERFSYDEGESQFGELYLATDSSGSASPNGRTILLIHGGCWMAEYGLDHTRLLAQALQRRGFHVWALEYRRVGERGGGWPGTFQDIRAGADYLRNLAERYPLALDKIVAVGHSAGAQLALWLAHQETSPEPALDTGERSRSQGSLTLESTVALAGVTDLERANREQVCQDSVRQLLGDDTNAAERIRAVSPFHLLPLGVRQVLIHGSEDSIVPYEYSERYAERAESHGDEVELHRVERAGHFELIVPSGPSWEVLLRALNDTRRSSLDGA